jgi:hypothetical protein
MHDINATAEVSKCNKLIISGNVLKMFVKATYVFNEKGKEEEKTAQIGHNVRAHIFNTRLLARSQFAYRRSCNRPIRSTFSVVFLGPRANANLVLKFHVALHASHAALAMVTLKVSP